jgi:hypothetical protein
MNYFRRIMGTLLYAFMLTLFIGCSNGKDRNAESNENQTEPVLTSTKCIVGKWTCNDNGNILVFVFDEGNTGFENIGDEDRHFVYTFKDGHPAISYSGDVSEWQLTLDCENNVLSVFGLTYKKS